MDANPKKTDRMALIIVIAIIIMALLILSNVAHAESGSGPAQGTLGCQAYTGSCLISADGLGQAASTLCEDGRHFAGASVWAGRVFDPEHYYTVKGCADGATGIKHVRIGAKWR